MHAGEVLGSYLLRREIGEGGIAAVFIAEHVQQKVEVVVKLLRDEFMTQPQTVAVFLKEPRAMQNVEHENTLEVIDVVAEGDHRYFVTELLHGCSLAELLRRGPLALPRALHIARQVATVLAHAHDVDVVHRNIKPNNVFLVKRDGEADFVKLLELGATRMQNQGDKPVPGTVIGTPAYMAPEQLRQLAGDHRVDMYSFGVLLFELVVGRKPFVGEMSDVIRQHLLEPAPLARSLLPSVPQALEALIAQCLLKDPAARPVSMHEVSLALGTLEEPEAVVVADEAPTSWAVPKNTSGYTTIVPTALSAPVPFDDEPGFQSVTAENELPKSTTPSKSDVVTDEPAPPAAAASAAQSPPAPPAIEIDATLRAAPPTKTAPSWQPIAAAGAALVAMVLAVVVVSGPATPAETPVALVDAGVAPPVAPLDPVGVPRDAPAVPTDGKPAVASQKDSQVVAFSSTPSGAQVWIRLDRRIRMLCTTPCTFDLPTGKEVFVELKRDGYRSAQGTITVAPDARFAGTLRRR